MLEYLIDENNIDFIEKSDIKFIGSLIKGGRPKEVEEEKGKNIVLKLLSTIEWMYQIVANKKNSLDVDKLDYLRRDSEFLNIIGGCKFDHERIIKGCRIINNNLCYNQKLYNDLTQVYMSRY